MKALTRLGWTAMALLCLYVGANALLYLTPGFEGPGFVVANAMALPWLTIHAGIATAALVIGPLQLLPAIRRRAPVVHRWLGRSYMVASILSGVAGLILAFGTTAGPIALAGFALLALASLACAAQAWRRAIERRFDAHREWAIRGYALILAGVTLRLWLPASMIAGLDLMASYRVIAFLCWVPNLLTAELYLATTRGRWRVIGTA